MQHSCICGHGEPRQFRGALPESLKAVIFRPFSANHFQYFEKAFG